MEWLGAILLALGALALASLYGWDYYQRQQQARNEREREQRLADYPETDTVGEVRVRRGSQVEPIFGPSEDVPPLVPKEAAKAAAKAATKAAAPDPVPLPAEWIVQLSLVCRESGGYNGEVVMQALDEVGLEYGAMRIFHRYSVNQSGQPRTLHFSVANLAQPGYFTPEDAAEAFVPGLVVFMRLPGPHSPVAALNDLLFTLETLQNLLGGELRDQHKQPLTPSIQTALRDQVERFEQRRQA